MTWHLWLRTYLLTYVNCKLHKYKQNIKILQVIFGYTSNYYSKLKNKIMNIKFKLNTKSRNGWLKIFYQFFVVIKKPLKIKSCLRKGVSVYSTKRQKVTQRKWVDRLFSLSSFIAFSFALRVLWHFCMMEWPLMSGVIACKSDKAVKYESGVDFMVLCSIFRNLIFQFLDLITAA